MSDDRCDVAVVGSGAGGAPVALSLARAGADVVILEKGRHPTAEELSHDEVRIERGRSFVPDEDQEPHTLRYRDDVEAQPTREGWTANVVGGGTVHFSGFFHRMKPVDMRLLSTLGAVDGASLADWPITYAELEPYYARCEQEIGVSGEWRRHPFEEPRSANYPLPPLDEHPIGVVIDEAATQLGMHTFPTPRAILSRSFRGRPACAYCPMCAGYGCPSGAKGSTLVSLLPAATATGHCEIRAGCMATQVLVEDGKVAGVVYRDRRGMNRFLQARCVVLACTAVETARLLLLSRSSRFSNGLANSSGLVGKNAVFSANCLGDALFSSRGSSRRWSEEPLLGRSAQRSLQDFYFLDEPIDGVHKGGTISLLTSEGGPVGMAELAARLRRRVLESTAEEEEETEILWGARLKEQLRRTKRGLRLHFECFCEFYANRGTYVDLDPRRKDAWGVPVARMTVQAHPLSRKAATLLGDRSLRLVNVLGPDEASIHQPYMETKFLQGGTCRFGDDPATSVLDRNCRAHDVPNLYVTDSSFLPTSGGVPPTMTIMANAFRVADGIAARMRSGAL